MRLKLFFFSYLKLNATGLILHHLWCKLKGFKIVQTCFCLLLPARVSCSALPAAPRRTAGYTYLLCSGPLINSHIHVWATCGNQSESMLSLPFKEQVAPTQNGIIQQVYNQYQAPVVIEICCSPGFWFLFVRYDKDNKCLVSVFGSNNTKVAQALSGSTLKVDPTAVIPSCLLRLIRLYDCHN